MALVQAGEEQAFAVLARRYQETLYRHIYQRLGDEEDAKDILQNIYVSLWNNRHTVQVTDSLLPYLSRSARFSVINEYLFRKKRLAFEAYAALLIEPVSLPQEDILIAEELQQEFEQQLLKMPGAVQEVFRLSRQEGLSSREIALRLDLTEQTVRNYISTALRSLRGHLAKKDVALLLFVASAVLFPEQ
ncbi:RNA polymerase sigma-70 factor (ECF subfamily) [Mucilaginibacter oryzae]|uniref:RNA polymerase sigma-70 factor (ECF subfamily) n=2 Tax=Mucilaginibacter oryzae TaxID=468058 RepID=A0A316HAJ2_9SPHI|nr:RNA polymerase sigma-70 factor (ECF subfamily) [Mucilaginibacter oryzae]